MINPYKKQSALFNQTDEETEKRIKAAAFLNDSHIVEDVKQDIETLKVSLVIGLIMVPTFIAAYYFQPGHADNSFAFNLFLAAATSFLTLFVLVCLYAVAIPAMIYVDKKCQSLKNMVYYLFYKKKYGFLLDKESDK